MTQHHENRRNSSAPDVAILMTVYNGMPHLADAIQSIKDQTLQDWKFVIVNDGSTDGTREFLDQIDDSRFVIVHQENTGTAGAANHGLEHVDTPFVARMDDDDISLPERLEKQAAFLRDHPEVGLVGAQMAPLGSSGVGRSLEMPVTHGEVMDYMMSGQHGLAHSCIMMRTEVVKQVGGYWQYNLNDAWDLMIRMGEAAEVANIDEVLHYYRVHEGSQNGYAMRKMRFSIDFACELARRRQQDLPAIEPEEFQQIRDQRSRFTRTCESLELHARTQYRLAIAEIHGAHRIRGLMRMVWAACCAPHLTFARVRRSLKRRHQPNSLSIGLKAVLGRSLAKGRGKHFPSLVFSSESNRRGIQSPAKFSVYFLNENSPRRWRTSPAPALPRAWLLGSNAGAASA